MSKTLHGIQALQIGLTAAFHARKALLIPSRINTLRQRLHGHAPACPAEAAAPAGTMPLRGILPAHNAGTTATPRTQELPLRKA